MCGAFRLLFALRYLGRLRALDALRRGRVQFAGIHLPLGRPELARRGSIVHQAFGPLLRLGREKMILACHRSQGIIVARGNPLGLRAVADLPRARIVNRPAGTGTRALFDELLRDEGVDAGTLRGYELDEATHLSVAAAVAAGAADAGFGIAAAASRHGLDFVPVVREAYFLVCEAADVDAEPATRLREVLASDAWRAALGALDGYDAEGAGGVVSLRRTLPWYR